MDPPAVLVDHGSASGAAAAGDPDGAAGDAGSDAGGAGALDVLEAKLVETLDTLLKLGMTVFDYQPESGEVLNRRINTLIQCLADLDDMKRDIDVSIPVSLLEIVDNGINPDLYTSDMVQALVDKNQKTNGRVESIKMLRDELWRELSRNFPDQRGYGAQMLQPPQFLPPQQQVPQITGTASPDEPAGDTASAPAQGLPQHP
ncbi:Mediator of RNA polymerase II transcription subunit 10 [Polyrhizophydium stewartii]|uniref:Mediator of RNA polymerase II transcription subunit 10 n=1 Tax=Polyrhizophydium stewartii TaxID=2732419 RepID=A0ABR4N232_9FUNG|nr:Mediator of RNA polymerase II transcription subunit 10 [Polyrhizophydium stewartii]